MGFESVAAGPGVRFIRAQRDVLGGDLRGHADLEKLAGEPHLYGLGPLEGLRGEVSIFDGAISIARIERDAVVTTVGSSERACFLVWAQVEVWLERAPGTAVADLEQLEALVIGLAGEAGLDPGRPFPFRAVGTAASVMFHVLDKRDGLPHNPERHEQAKVRRVLDHVPVELVGFYSRHHHGVFTPRESNVHVHLRTGDGRASGHLEAIRLEPGGRIAVPATGWRQ